MTLAGLYELTEAEFDLCDFRPAQKSPSAWTITTGRRQSIPPTSAKDIVGRGDTEESALRDLRLQWVVEKYGDYRG